MIKVDVNIVKECARDKQKFDALCLAILFKQKFANSIIYHHSVRDMMAITHLGKERCFTAISNGKKLGLFNDTARGLEIAKLHIRGKKQRYFKVEDDTFKGIVSFLREQLILDKANQVYWAKNIIDKAKGESLSKREMKGYKLLKKRGVDFDNTDYAGTINQKVFAEMLGCSIANINVLLRKMKNKGMIAILPTILTLGSIGNFDFNLCNKYYDDGGFIKVKDGVAYCQIANMYIPKIEVK